jgi:regulator of sigma E protease
MNIVIAILIFSMIILFHELGHFLLAKKNGIRVNEFSLGLGPTIFGIQKGETKYSIKLLPFGGACMMEGEDSESQDGRAFSNKSVWARLSVIVAGPLFNFIMAFVFAVILIAYMGIDKPLISETVTGSPAQEAGLQAGDEIISMNGFKTHFFREVSLYPLFYPGETIKIEYERDNERFTTQVKPKYNEEEKRYLFGINGGIREKGNAIEVVQNSVYELRYWIYSTVQSLRMLVTRQIGADQISGPVGLVGMISDTIDDSKSGGVFLIFINMLNISILLSANLGVMNLLPLPALDGGRIIFLIIEAVRRKRIDPEKEGVIHFVGLLLLMGLMIYVMFNDIIKIF